MSLAQFISNLNNTRINRQLKTIQKYVNTHVDCKLLILIYDEGLHIYDASKNMMIADLNVMS
jgi:hypothetical protein